MTGAGVRYDCPNWIVNFVRKRRRQFAHHRNAPHPGQFHVLALVLQLRLLARGNVDHRRENKETLAGVDRIEPHFDGKFAAVFAPANA